MDICEDSHDSKGWRQPRCSSLRDGVIKYDGCVPWEDHNLEAMNLTRWYIYLKNLMRSFKSKLKDEIDSRKPFVQLKNTCLHKVLLQLYAYVKMPKYFREAAYGGWNKK